MKNIKNESDSYIFLRFTVWKSVPYLDLPSPKVLDPPDWYEIRCLQTTRKHQVPVQKIRKIEGWFLGNRTGTVRNFSELILSYLCRGDRMSRKTRRIDKIVVSRLFHKKICGPKPKPNVLPIPTTLPAVPTMRAMHAVRYPLPEPTSRARIPGFRWSFRISKMREHMKSQL